MTSDYTIDAFANEFDDAVNQLHQDRHDHPSGEAWDRVRNQAMRADAADPRAICPGLPAGPGRLYERTQDMDATLRAPLTSGSTVHTRTSWTQWLTIAASAVIVIGLVLTMFALQNSGDGDNKQLAWAPVSGTPEGTPGAPAVEYGPEYTCEAEPLTPDQVFDIVMNPARGYAHYEGKEDPTAQESLWESTYNWTREPDLTGFSRYSENSVSLEQATFAANEFIDCLNEGTALQVWALLDPAIVQIDILSRFPVIRSESDIREFVETFGGEKYNSDGAGMLLQTDGRASESRNNHWVGSSNIDGRRDDLAVISVITEGNTPNILLSLQQYPGDVWLVTGIYSTGGEG